MKVKNRFPIYIPSKGRADSRLTIKALEEMKVPYTVVIEEQDYSEYAKVVAKKNILVLDKTYQDEYDTCDDLGDKKSKGPGPARNFIWQNSIDRGYEYHWVMDDNIKCFRRWQNNLEIKCIDGTPFKVMEDFVTRYKNIGMAGPNYTFFVIDKWAHQYGPFTVNTRIYSCNLIKNDLPLPDRWRGRYNEDTDLSLRILKKGWCTVQFNVFLQEKANTQTLKGGNTDEFYAEEGTIPKSNMQMRLHPDVTKLVWRYGRHHHYVNYNKFKRENKLIFRDDYKPKKGVNNYGMKLKKIET